MFEFDDPTRPIFSPLASQEMEKKGELEDGDPLNGFFKKIFAQGDEDTRRAMMKSFVESNGTVLSTNWWVQVEGRDKLMGDAALSWIPGVWRTGSPCDFSR